MSALEAVILVALSFMPGISRGQSTVPQPSDPQQLSPAHRVSVKPLDLTRAPTEDDLIAAGQLGGPLFPTHELADKQREEAARWSFGNAINEWNKHEYRKAVAMFRQHVKDFPDSPWAGEASLHTACDATYNGRYNEAETLFNQLIIAHQGKDHPGAKMLVNKARQRLALLKVAQNDLAGARDLLATLFKETPDWRQRTYASHWLVRISQFTAAKQKLVSCGADALAYVLKKEGREAEAQQVRTNLPATMRGFTIGDLSRLAAVHGHELVAIETTSAALSLLPLPAILHVGPKNSGADGHYWVLDKLQDDNAELFDPQSHHRFHQTVAELASQWSGRALLFSAPAPLPGRKLELGELEQSAGGCCGVPPPEDDLGCKPCKKRMMSSAVSCCGGGASGMGAPIWFVNAANMNFNVADTPLWYHPAYGPMVAISLSWNSSSAIAYNEPFGNKWAFSYATYLTMDTSGLITVFMPDGKRDLYYPNGTGGYYGGYQVYNTLVFIAANHYELQFPDGTVYVYQIPAGVNSQQPFLTEIRDSYGQKLSFGFDANADLTTITDAQGLVTRLSYNVTGQVTNVADPFGRHATFQYDAQQNLVQITDMGGYSTSFTYDDSIYLTSMTDPRGTWNFYFEGANGSGVPDEYPPPGTPMYENFRITVTNPLGGQEEFFYYGGCDIDGYGGCGGYSWYVSPRDYIPWASPQVNNYASRTPKTRYLFGRYDSGQHGEITELLRPESDYEVFTYDEMGNPLTSSDPYGNIWKCTYNWMGEPTSVTDPKGTRTTYTYANNGVDLLTISNGLGQVSLAYNPQHDLISVTDQLTNVTSFAYNTLGQLTSRVDAIGITNTYLYDASNRPSQLLRAGQLVATMASDGVGRIHAYTDATGLTVTYDYDSLDRLTRITYPDTKFDSLIYSACCPHLLDSVTDRGGRTASFTYDALKRLSTLINPEGGLTRFLYDLNSQLTQIIDPNGNATGFAYDLDNRLVQRIYADGRGLMVTYDAAGRLATRTDARSATTTFSWDNNDNLQSIVFSDGTPGVTNVYDSFDRMVMAVGEIGTNSYTWDAASRLLNVSGPFPGEGLSYTYDALGRQTGLSVQGSPPVTYFYDNLNRLVSVATAAGNYAFLYTGANPLLQAITRPNGSVTSYQYDVLERLLLLSNQRSGGQVISQFQYTYDAQDMRSSETISNGMPFSLTNNLSISNAFNSLNQLTSSSASQSFLYDLNGNLTRGYTPDGYRFTAAYDANDRLKTLGFTDGDGAVVLKDYLYNGSGLVLEIKTYRNGQLTNDTRYVYDGLIPTQERDSSNNVVREYIWGSRGLGGLGSLLALNQGAQDYSYIYDGKCNVAAVLDTNQTAVAAYAYDVFGGILAKAGIVDQPVRFSTKPYDDKTGLSLFPFRFFVPSTGRWLSRDLLAESGGANLYGYSRNNPISYSDPYGLMDLNLLPAGDPRSDWVDQQNSPASEFWVAGHADAAGEWTGWPKTEVDGGSGKAMAPINPNELGEKIYQKLKADEAVGGNKIKTVKSVRLFVCKAGKNKSYLKAVKQYLADRGVHVEVEGPNTEIRPTQAQGLRGLGGRLGDLELNGIVDFVDGNLQPAKGQWISTRPSK